MAVGDVYRTQFHMNVNERIVSTDLHWEETSPRLGTVAQVTGTLGFDAQEAFWTTFWKPFLSNNNFYETTRTQMIYPTREMPGIQVNRQGEAGTAVGDSMNGQTATLIAQYGVTWNREFQGRAFLPGLGEDLADAGRLTTITFALLGPAATTFYTTPLTLAGPAGGTYTPVVLSPKRLKAATPPVVNTLGTVIVRTRISRQGRRKTLATSTT